MRAPDELSCRELIELITDHLEDALSADDRARFDRHLATCPRCRAYLDQMRLTIALTGQLSEDDLSPESRDALLETFRAWKATSDPPGVG